MKNVDQLIDEASKDSFPASDPPAWTTGIQKNPGNTASQEKPKTRKDDPPDSPGNQAVS